MIIFVLVCTLLLLALTEILSRREETVSTPWGDVRVKRAGGLGVERMKPEYDDIAALARAHGLSLADVRKEIRA